MHLFAASVVCLVLALSFPNIVSKLEDNFTQCSEFFFNGVSPVILGILENSKPKNKNDRVICQKYKNKTRYATLYDTGKMIPLFSAYKYTGTEEFTRPEIPWMIELQLEPSGAEMCVPFVNQASKEYWRNNAVYRPSSLFPMNHTADKETAESTLTLTNSVPQNISFKQEIWTYVENAIRENMDSYCQDNNKKTVAYVLTGVIPGKEMLNDRVNIPSHMWTAFCCYNSAETSLVSQTYWTGNIPDNGVTNITLRSLEDLQIFLNETLGRKVELFINDCMQMYTEKKKSGNKWIEYCQKIGQNCFELIEYCREIGRNCWLFLERIFQ